MMFFVKKSVDENLKYASFTSAVILCQAVFSAPFGLRAAMSFV
jgi:hypothetical protein